MTPDRGRERLLPIILVCRNGLSLQGARVNEQARTDAQADGEAIRAEAENPGAGALQRPALGIARPRPSPSPRMAATEYVNKAFAEGVGRPAGGDRRHRPCWRWSFPRKRRDEALCIPEPGLPHRGRGKVIEVRVPRADGDRSLHTTISPVKTMIIFGVLVSGKVFVISRTSPRSSWRRKSAWAWSASCSTPRSWRAWGSWPAASRTTSTTSSPPSSATRTSPSRNSPRPRRCGRWWSRSRPRPSAPPNSPGRCSSSPGGGSWRPCPSISRSPCGRWCNSSPRPSPRRRNCASTSPRGSRRSRPTRPSCARSS